MNKIYALVCVEITNESLDRLFHYTIPEVIQHVITAGMRVSVPFGSRSKPICGYVVGFSDETDIPHSKIKSINGLYESYPVFSANMLSLAQWMQEKYYTTLANCLNCILPPGLSGKVGNLNKTGLSGLVEADVSSVETKERLHINLTQEQLEVVNEILDRLETGDPQPILLHGVTGSGKTEVYLHAIAKVMEMGKQAIMLVPEISLTPQTVSAFKKRFGDAAAVTHSRLTAKERLIQWQKARLGKVSVMIGPRSAIFTPFDKPGIIIIDEEHETTYRSESAPKFDTREVAVKMSELAGALVVMGSATPSLETYYQSSSSTKVEDGFRLLTMAQRVNGMFPEVHVVDLRRELATGNTSIFGRAFQEAIAENLAAERQVILFINRRGHSSFVSCRRCGHVMGCDNCRVNLTYHANEYSSGLLICHYCGRTSQVPKICIACESPFIRYFGVGTQKVEEEVAKLFPGAKALRMDMDTTRSKQGHTKILSAFRKGEAQILIGTQMIAKGLDFPNVTLVGVVAADLSLFSGDFRAAEHTFQLLTQVSGRAGRAEKSGRVFIQTYNPEHYSISLAKDADYNTFYTQELSIRSTMGYPPFSHVFMVLFVGPDERAIIMALNKLLAVMRYCNKKGLFEMLGPAPAFVSKIKKQFRWKLLVKCTQEETLKRFVLYCLGKLKENDPLTGIGIHLTLNPLAME
ncbi:MAG: primosomal protein N' [Defluviitaleaceae bacterium]|nr:primosomal protein N' [Defluviitaleaceae bacterium]